MRQQIRFLYVGNHAGYFITHRLPVMLALRDAGYEIHVAAPIEADALEKIVAENAVQKIRDMGFQYHPIPIKRGSIGLTGEIRLFLRLVQLYRQIKPDIVYHATIKPVLYGGIIARLTGVRAVISSVTGLGYIFISQDLKARLLRGGVKTAYRLALNHPNIGVLFQNEDDQCTFIEQKLVKEINTSVIKGSGVDTEKFYATSEPDGVPVVVLPSRMLWDKGVGEFVEAARQVHTVGIQARFVLAGDPDPDNPAAISNDQLQKWHDEGVVKWIGWQSDMADVLRRSHIVCLPSYREGIPKALIEAAASGRPIITTDVPGCRETVRNGENGLLVPVRTVEPLADALCRLIQDTDLRRRMGKKSREIAETEFSKDIIIRKTLAICEALL
jgi:glycosyltransferase involved in cell wall biosynthesis